MSWIDCKTPMERRSACESVDTIVIPRARDIGGFDVHRALPSFQRQMVGPFIFFDEMGPAEFPPGQSLDIRPHPHIGLSTVTYLLRGEIMHRDSLGTELAINPGAVNWMTAGRGITHSERTRPEIRECGGALAGIQSWVALPQSHEESAPSFAHHGKESLPRLEDSGKSIRLIAGSLFGMHAPVKTHSSLFYADVMLNENARLHVPVDYEERALYVLSGQLQIAGEVFEPRRLLVLRPGKEAVVTATRNSRFMLLGGETMDGPRFIWWNFVASSKELIEDAKERWRKGEFPSVPRETDFIPLPA